MRWSWKGPLVLVGVAVLTYFVFIFVAGIVMIAQGFIGPMETILLILAIVFLLALFVGSGFVAAKVEEFIQRRKSKPQV